MEFHIPLSGLAKKVCPECQKEKFLSEFHNRTVKGRIIPSSRCKKCAIRVSSNWYKGLSGQKKQEVKDRVNSRSKAIKQEILEKINKIKGKYGCFVCEENEPCCLDFHHLDPSTKKFNISVSYRRSTKKFLDELDKCIVLCANCHRKLHAGIIALD